MLTALFIKAVRDRWVAASVAAGALTVWLFLAMAIYRDINLSLYTDLPAGMRELFGIPDGADAATLSYNVMLGFAGALTLAGLSISIGASAVAGEERDGTIGLLLANPQSRSRLVLSKTASMGVLIGAAAAAVWVACLVTPYLLGVDVGSTDITAMMLHLTVNAWFYGLLALTIGAATGSRTISVAAASGVLIISYFASGLLPLVDGLAGFAKVFPWYYFDSSDPLINGLHAGHLALSGGACAALVGAALIAVNRRDLNEHDAGISLLHALRTNPTTQRVFDRLAGSTRVSRLWIKTASEHQGLLIVTSGVMFLLMGVLMGPMFTAIEATLVEVGDQFPEEVLALTGGGDLSTPEGWFQSETFSLTAPIAVMIVTIVIGGRGLAGEEGGGTIGLLLANPVKRSTIVIEQARAMALYAITVGASIFAGVSIASIISGLGMSIGNIAATATLVTLLGMMFGALSLAVSAGTGRAGVATYVTIGVALTSYLLNSFLPLSTNLAGGAKWTPHHYYLGSDPLNNGMPWGHAAVLAVLCAALLAAAVALFQRRDLRSH